MATSGTTDFNLTRNDIITEAYELLGVIGEGESPNSDQIERADRTLNMLIKTWQADQMNLWAVQRCVLFINKGQEKYVLGPDTTDHFTTINQVVNTTIATVTAAAQNTIIVDSVAGLAIGNYIGVSYGVTVQWSTITNIVGTTVTLADNLTSDTTVGNKVTAYATKAGRPMEVMEGYTHQSKSNTDIPVQKLSRRKYDTLAAKYNTGRVNQFYYDKQRTNGDLYVWPTGDDEEDYLKLIVQRTLQDMDNADDDFDFPQEWFLPLATNLALLLTTKYGVEQDVYYQIKSEADKWYTTCKDWDEELYTSIYLQPDPQHWRI